MRLIHAFVGVLGSVVVFSGAACGGAGEVNSTSSHTDTGGAGTGATGTGASGGTGTTGTGATGTGATNTGGTTTGGTGGTGGTTTTSSSMPPQCSTAADCDAQFGPAACGAWGCFLGVCEANSPGCTDADHDGYGTGATCTCAGLDCDDTDPAIHDNTTTSCYSGPAGTAGVGTCHAGVQTCTAGVWSPCVGEVTPSGEACNGQDDDCNGVADDALGNFSCGLGACAKTVPACIGGMVQACVPLQPAPGTIDGPNANGIDDDCDGLVDENAPTNCIPVALTGDDTIAGAATMPPFAMPFKTIQAAINWAATHASLKTVCVAAGPACGATGTYTMPAAPGPQTVTMANGVSVLGNYEATTFTRCTNSTTVIQPLTPEGVTFPATVVTATALDGFRIDRFSAATTAGITVNGAKGAQISNIAITNTPTVSSSYGVNVINGADVLITNQNRIQAGLGTLESIGVRVVGSRVTIQNNCTTLDAAGRCTSFCGGGPGILGRLGLGTGDTYGVLLDNAPGSLIQSSSICQNNADHGAGIKIVGDGTGIQVRGVHINGDGGLLDSHGIWMEDCNGAAPWIVDNALITAQGVNQMSRVDGIRAIGDCHPVIDSNVQIGGGGEGMASSPTGVHCAANAQNVPSQCVVLGNASIRGSSNGFPPTATGVRCDNGSCLRVAGNVITGRGGQTSYGVYLQTTGTFVDDNVIWGGCSAKVYGVYADDVFARLQNNQVFGFSGQDCAVGANPNLTESFGMYVRVSLGVNEIDVHSNDIDGTGRMSACVSRAVMLDVGAMPPAGGVGIFRNNILRAGSCNTSRYGFVEAVTGADPRVFEHNDLDPFMSPTALYFDEGTTALTTAAAVNALTDITVNGTLSVDPMYVAYPNDLHLSAGSMCIGAGTPNGAPPLDMDGTPRDPATPDIGADEN